MHFVGLVAGLVPNKQFLLHVGNAYGRHDCRNHILEREYAVEHLACWNLPWPAHHEGRAEPAFPAKPFLATERSGPAIRPAKLLCAVVRCEDDNGIVSDTQLVEFLQKLTDHPVEF